MNSGVFMEKHKRNKESQETKLEIEVQGCSHLALNPENLKKFLINLDTDDATKIDIGEIRIESEANVLCRLTLKPCVLYTLGGGVIPHINYHHLERCPSSEDSVKKYKLRGKKKGSLFYTSEIERIKEEK